MNAEQRIEENRLLIRCGSVNNIRVVGSYTFTPFVKDAQPEQEQEQ